MRLLHVIVLTGLLACLPLWTGFDLRAGGAMQFTEFAPWIAFLNVNYHLGVDGISMPLIVLNSFMTVLVVIAHWEVITDKVGQYLAAFLIMSGLLKAFHCVINMKLDGIRFIKPDTAFLI